MKKQKRKTRFLAGLAALAALGGAGPARGSELSDIQETQKKILERLDAQEKILQSIQQRVNTMQAGGGRPQIDPNKVYNIPIGQSAVKGPKDAKVALLEFSDFQ